jgi:hypothetical protein
MPKKIQLSIPKPCHEDWDAMTPVEKGKFCGSCQKQVVDFSNMNERQVAEFFKKPSTGSVCGRFMTDQLDREIEIPRKRIPWLKYFFTIALPAFFVSLKSSASRSQGEIKVRKASADTTRRPIYADVKMMGMVSRPQRIKPFMGDTVVAPLNKPVVEDSIPVCTKPVMGKPAVDMTLRGEVAVVTSNNKRVFNGIVVNERGEPVPFASIEASKRTIVMADENGLFKIKKSQIGKKGELVISSAGYEKKTIVPEEENYLTGALYVVLKTNELLPEVVLTGTTGLVKGRYIVGGVIRGIKIKQPDRAETNISAHESTIRIYPNPLPSGSGLSIEWKQTEEGYYNLQLLNATGQSVHQKEIWIDAEARLLHIDLPAVAAGSYFLYITNKKTGKRLTEKILVQ